MNLVLCYSVHVHASHQHAFTKLHYGHMCSFKFLLLGRYLSAKYARTCGLKSIDMAGCYGAAAQPINEVSVQRLLASMDILRGVANLPQNRTQVHADLGICHFRRVPTTLPLCLLAHCARCKTGTACQRFIAIGPLVATPCG